MIALALGNNLLDLDPDVRVPLNFQASDANDIGSVLTSFTNSFDVPLTDRNRTTFENAGEVPSQTLLPYKILQCRLLVSGRDLFGLSRLVILEFDDMAGWKCSFFAGNTTASLNGTLRDLDLSAFNFQLTASNAANRANSSPASGGVLYGAVNCGVDNLIKQCDIRYSHFQFYISSLIDIIFKKQSIPVAIKNQNGTFFNRMVLPMLEPKKIQAEMSGFKAVRTTTQVLPEPSILTTIIFQSVVSGNLDGGYNAATGIFTANFPGKYKISGKLQINSTTNAGAERAIQIVMGGAGTWIGFSLVQVSEEGIIGNYYLEAGAEIEVITAPVTVQIRYGTDTNLGTSDTLQTDSSFIVESDNELLPGNTVDIAASMPDMTQADLFKEAMTMANAIAYFQYGSLTIMGFDRLQVSETIDMSNKLDTSQRSTTLLQSGLGRVTTFLYDNDQFAPNPTYGCAKVLFDNEVLEPTKEWAKLKFSACADAIFMSMIPTIKVPVWLEKRELGNGTVSRQGGAGSLSVVFTIAHGLAVGSYIFIAQSSQTYYVTAITSATVVTVFRIAGEGLPVITGSTWSRVTYTRQNLKPRIGLALEVSNTTPFSFRSSFGTSTIVVNTHKQIVFNSPAPGTDGLGWTYMLNNFFLLWLGSMERYKLIRAWFNLTDDDAYQVDFTKSWYVSKLGAKFYLQRINKYIGSQEESTECEILAIQDFLDQNKIKPL